MTKNIHHPSGPRKGRPATGTAYQRGGRWVVQVRLPGGRRYTETLAPGTTEGRARETARAYAERAASTPPTAAPAPRTIGDMLEAWIEIVDARTDLAPATREGHRSAAARIRADFGAMVTCAEPCASPKGRTARRMSPGRRP